MEQQLKNERLIDKINKPKSKNIINQLAKLPTDYNGNINYINDKIEALKKRISRLCQFFRKLFYKK